MDTIEIEQEEELRNNDPFDPEAISISPKLLSLEGCLRRIQQGTIKLNPDFQRTEVWTMEKKSQLIESLMLNIPLPMFYVSADSKGNYTVVDGLQRLSAIRDYVLGQNFLKDQNKIELKGEGFRLEGLEFWNKYNDVVFNKLPVNLQNRIIETEFSFTVINPGTPEDVKRNIFKRINTGGMPLSSQEIRNALYTGFTTELLKTLSNLKEFVDVVGERFSSERMEDKELILHFLAFYIREYSTYKKTLSPDTHLSDAMIILNSFPSFSSKEFQKLEEESRVRKDDILIERIEHIEPRFKKAMKRAKLLFDKHAFRKSYGNRRRTPINRSLFELWTGVLAELTENNFEKIISMKNEFLEDYSVYLEENVFLLSISKHNMDSRSVSSRTKKINALIEKYIS